MPRQRFEELIVLQHINSLDMDSTGHSVNLIAGFRTATHELLMQQLRLHVTAQRCVALTADKVTVNPLFSGDCDVDGVCLTEHHQ